MEPNISRRKIGLGIIAGLTSISVLLGGVFDSSKDLLEDYPKTPKAVIDSIDDYSEDNLEKGGEKESYKEKLKRLIYKIPVRVRTVFFLPLWVLGTAILALADMIFKTLIAPFAHLILGFILQTLLLFLIIGICIKILFPDLPWSKIFSKKLFLSVLLGSIFISACDFVIPMFWEKYTFYRNITKFILGLVVILIILKPFIKKKLANRVTYEIKYKGKTLA
ncbi:MAG: hypothetical protein IK151_04735 [Erysipelotrichaceae bacterium]|nr:hypothetical protein [Erysipelotrichaceae bacterium]